MTIKVYVYPSDRWGCGSYRLIWPGGAIDPTDMDVVVHEPGEARNIGGKYDPRTMELYDEVYPPDADVIVLQRPTGLFQHQMITRLRARGVAVVVDMDDDLAHVEGTNPAFAMMSPKVIHPNHAKLAPVERHRTEARVPNYHSWHHATKACRAATLVTVTTPQLRASYGAHGRVRVLPNYVPARYLDVPHVDSDTFGWGGSVHSHPYDLQRVGPAVANLVSKDGYQFCQVGDPRGVARALGLREDPDTPGDVSLADWPTALTRFGVGIAPLADTRFNNAKSRLKPLEMAAVGVPAVVSPAADYLAWSREAPDACLVAEKPRQWEGTLRALLRDAGRREEMSAAGRAAAAANTIEGNAWRWAEAWSAAYLIEHATPRAVAGAT